MKYLEYFEDAYYINLDSRIDRKETFETKALNVGLVANRFSAIQLEFKDCPNSLIKELDENDLKTKTDNTYYKRRKLNEVGCCLSHRAIVKEAKERGLSNVMIFEDDCVFLDSWNENIQKCINDLKNINWDVIYFGGEPNNDCDSLTENLATSNHGGVYCCHAYAVNHTFFDKIINFDLEWCYIIDYFFVNYNVNQRTFVLPKKLLATQGSFYSDLRGHITNGECNWMVNAWEKYVKQ